MPADVFFDTAVLIYCIGQDDNKSGVADSLLAGGGVLSVQVLNEFANVAHRKLGMNWRDIEEALAEIRGLCAPPSPLTVNTHTAALRIAKQYGFHVYDSLIIASALESGCRILYSEDLQHEQKIESLTVQNPFLPS